MATIKSHTDLPQSKKLATILPLESADMCWQKIYDENHMISDYRVELIPYRLYGGIGVPCWSLAALLGVLPIGYSFVLVKSFNGEDYYCKLDGEPIETITDNPVDTCYKMINKLHELKML